MTLSVYGEPVRGRSCASCRLCCVLLPVEFDDGSWKKSLNPCTHLCGKGCRIYEARPLPCRVWSCRWLFDEETAALRRPDRSHYALDAMPDEVRMTDGLTGEVTMVEVLQVWVDPAFRDAWRDPALLAYIDKLGREHRMAAIIRWGNREALTIFPPSISSDGKWHEMGGELREDVGLYALHEDGNKPP